MRTLDLKTPGVLKTAGVAALTLAFACGVAWAADAQPKPTTADANDPYPAAVSLLDEPPKGWTYRQSPSNSPLYFYDKDTAGVSNCYGACTKKFEPLEAPETAKTLGEWTVVKRKDGKSQWAYHAHPVYTMVNDSVQKPAGDGAEGLWHLMPHFK